MAAPAAISVGEYLQEHKLRHITWHIILNNHASTRPKMHGGPIVKAVTKCKEYTAPGPASAEWQCTLDLPHSFANGDGIRLVTTGRGDTKDEASEIACLKAVATLVVQNPSSFLLRPAHWAVSREELLEGLPGVGPGHQALPVHVPARLQEAGAEAGTPEADARLMELVSQCLETHWGEFDPSWISHKWAGRGQHDERVYAEFNKLLPPGGMKAFIQSHPEFDWRPKDPLHPDKGMVITWAAPGSASAPPMATAPGSASASGGNALAGQTAQAATSSPRTLGGGPSSTPGAASAAPQKEVEADLVASARQARAAFLAQPGNQSRGVDDMIRVLKALPKPWIYINQNEELMLLNRETGRTVWTGPGPDART